jgi:hypothetical protein
MGGLACALALAKQGFTHLEIYEAASNLGFVGAGIQLAPNMAAAGLTSKKRLSTSRRPASDVLPLHVILDSTS